MTNNKMKKLKINFSLSLLIIVLMVGLLLVGVNQTNATTATSTGDTTVALDVGNMTIVDGSVVNSIITTATTITIEIISGQTFTLRSTDRKLLTNDSGFTYECFSDKSELIITSSTTKTVIITPSASACGTSGGSGGGGGGGGGTTTTTTTTTPTPTPTVSPATSPTPTPAPSTTKPTPASQGFVSLANVSLNDGDVVSAAGSDDPDVYIVNPHGYKRLFLNPAIFGFYGHLGFDKVKNTTSVTRDVFVTSGLFRNCETEDVKVYGVEITGEDIGMLHWVNTTGEQAVADDPDFFKKVFCINTNEFNWYPKGTDYTSVNQIPDYARGSFSASSSVPTSNQYKVVSTAGYLNVRASASTASSVLGQLTAGDTVTSLAQDGVWHNIMFEGQDAWVHGDYLEAI